jgi:hypothetical protein
VLGTLFKVDVEEVQQNQWADFCQGAEIIELNERRMA